MLKATLSVDKKWIELLDLEKEKIFLDKEVVKDQKLLEGLHSEASKINQSLKSIVIDLNKLVSDSSFYQEQRSQFWPF